MYNWQCTIVRLAQNAPDRENRFEEPIDTNRAYLAKPVELSYDTYVWHRPGGL